MLILRKHLIALIHWHDIPKIMKTVFHSSDSRGYVNHGWLEARHSFSFANWFNPNRIQFGALRVLNDDIIAPGMGFGTHPHDNMEIITIPLIGDLEHKDSMGHAEVIREGEIQVMSAGTGVTHSEYNHNKDQPINLLQLWIFPNRRQVTPRYKQMTIADLIETNKISQILSPNEDDQGVWIHQNAWFHLLKTDRETSETYQVRQTGNGVYVFVIEGNAAIGSQQLNKRDALGVWDVEQFDLSTSDGSSILLVEVPMEY